MSLNSTMRSGAILGAACLAAALAGCTYDPHPELTKHAQAVLPTEQFSIGVTSEPEKIALGLHSAGLSPMQQAALGQFVARWREDGGGTITLAAPNDTRDPSTARHMEDTTAAYLVQLGVPAERVRLAGYRAGPEPRTPLLASYDRFEASRPNCSGGWKDLTTTGSNTPYDHFGCATTANIAAMVANPRDLLAPAVETPADDSRREVVLGKYRNGQVTSSSKDSQADGKVSESGGGG